MRHRSVILAVSIVAVAAFVVGNMALRNLSQQPQSLLQTYVVDGYPLDNSPDAAIAFPGNETIVLGQVGEFLGPVLRDGPEGAPGSGMVYTPVEVTVIETLRGKPRVMDGVMLVRHLGGRVGDVEYQVSVELAPAGLEAGNTVLLFLGEQRDLGDGYDAATPNMIYVVDGKGIATSSDGRWNLSVDRFRSLLTR